MLRAPDDVASTSFVMSKTESVGSAAATEYGISTDVTPTATSFGEPEMDVLAGYRHFLHVS